MARKKAGMKPEAIEDGGLFGDIGLVYEDDPTIRRMKAEETAEPAEETPAAEPDETKSREAAAVEAVSEAPVPEDAESEEADEEEDAPEAQAGEADGGSGGGLVSHVEDVMPCDVE